MATDSAAGMRTRTATRVAAAGAARVAIGRTRQFGIAILLLHGRLALENRGFEVVERLRGSEVFE
jgi:hypothetical protein